MTARGRVICQVEGFSMRTSFLDAGGGVNKEKKEEAIGYLP
jgi:hypothetical protein